MRPITKSGAFEMCLMAMAVLLTAWVVTLLFPGCVGHVTFEMAPTATSGTGYQTGTANRMRAAASQPHAPASQPVEIKVPLLPVP